VSLRIFSTFLKIGFNLNYDRLDNFTYKIDKEIKQKLHVIVYTGACKYYGLFIYLQRWTDRLAQNEHCHISREIEKGENFLDTVSLFV